MFSLIGTLAVVAYLPGAAIFRLPIADRDRRAALAAEERAFWAVVLSVLVSSSATLALAALGAYRFRRLLTIDLLVTLTALAVANRRILLGRVAPPPRTTALVPVALAALGLWLYFPQAEYVMGGKDPGTYMNEGIQIAQRGGLVIHDPIVAAVPRESRDLFFPSHENPAYYGLRFMGFHILDPDRGTVLGQFPHLFPASIAIGYGINGLSGARQTIALWGILGVIAVYFAGARLFGRLPAAAGATLLAIHVTQVWFARYPNAELVMQALVFAAILAWGRAHLDDIGFFAPVAGATLALLAFLRFDAVLAVAAIGAASLLLVVVGERLRAGFFVTLAAGLSLAAIYLVRTMVPYAVYPLGFVRNLQPMHLALLGVGMGALVTLPLLRRSPRIVEFIRRWLPVAVILVVVSGTAYAVLLRQPGGRLTDYNAYALRTFTAFYLSPAGLVAALVGFVLVVRRAFWRDPALILTTVIFAFFFFYKVRIVPEHFWMARRFLPVILPAALLFAAAGVLSAVQVWRVAPERYWRRATVSLLLAAAVLGLLGRHYATATARVTPHVEYAGIIPRLEKLAARFGDRDLVIVESRAAASDIHVLALPLAYIYARNVLVLNTPRPDHDAFARFLGWARGQYREVFFLGGGGTDLLTRSIGVSAVASERFQVPEYESPLNAYPRGVRGKEFDYGIYRFVERPAVGDWFDLDVGTMDDLHVVRFHAKERSGDVTFRWTRDVSYVALSGLRADSRTLTMWLHDGKRPAAAGAAQVTVSVDDRQIGQVVVGSGFRPYTFDIPADLVQAAATRDAPVRLKLHATTWNPRAAIGLPDDRDLGVMVDRVEVR
jgi:hypothetical protein